MGCDSEIPQYLRPEPVRSASVSLGPKGPGPRGPHSRTGRAAIGDCRPCQDNGHDKAFPLHPK
jgi:hypothetical protein